MSTLEDIELKAQDFVRITIEEEFYDTVDLESSVSFVSPLREKDSDLSSDVGAPVHIVKGVPTKDSDLSSDVGAPVHFVKGVPTKDSDLSSDVGAPVHKVMGVPTKGFDWSGVLDPPTNFARGVSVEDAEQVQKVFSVNENHIRASSLSSVMQGFAAVMTGVCTGGSWWASEDTYRCKSQPVPPPEQLYGFLSHTWSTARWCKFLQLAFLFNLVPAMGCSFIAAVTGSVISVAWRMPTMHFEGQTSPPTCIGGFVMGSVVYFLTFVFWFEGRALVNRWVRTPMVFLDRLCINQQDAALKDQGVATLGVALKQSQSLIVLYSSDYFNRLWTSFELAVFLATHSVDDVVIVPWFLPVLVMGGAMLWTLLSFTVKAVTCSEAAGTISGDVFVPILAAAALATLCYGCILLRRWHVHRVEVDDKLSTYDLRHTECSNGNDRSIVQGAISAMERVGGFVNPFATNEEAIESYNSRVQTDVRAAVATMLGNGRLRYWWICAIVWTEVFWLPDKLAGMYLEAWPVRMMFLETLSHIHHTFIALPLCVSVLCYVSNHCVRFHSMCFAEAALISSCVWFCAVTFVLLMETTSQLTKAAREDDLILGMWGVGLFCSLVLAIVLGTCGRHARRGSSMAPVLGTVRAA